LHFIVIYHINGGRRFLERDFSRPYGVKSQKTKSFIPHLKDMNPVVLLWPVILLGCYTYIKVINSERSKLVGYTAHTTLHINSTLKEFEVCGIIFPPCYFI
jgi:hypothetical protein